MDSKSILSLLQERHLEGYNETVASHIWLSAVGLLSTAGLSCIQVFHRQIYYHAYIYIHGTDSCFS